MKFRCVLPALLFVAVAAAAGAPEPAVDPSKLKDKVTIGVGQSLAVQFEQEGTLARPKVIPKVVDEPPTLSLDFRKQGEMLILATKNPFPRDLEFRALARLKGRQDYFETSIVPVKAGLFGLELWQDPIEELVLFGFKFVGPAS